MPSAHVNVIGFDPDLVSWQSNVGRNQVDYCAALWKDVAPVHRVAVEPEELWLCLKSPRTKVSTPDPHLTAEPTHHSGKSRDEVCAYMPPVCVLKILELA